MPSNTTIKYIKALIAIRLFNQSLWMEEESISAIPLDRFNSQEVQDAITAGELIEVSRLDLPTDVVSPTWRLKGDWDPSNGQLPIGRRYGDSYKILTPGGVVGTVELKEGQRVIFTSLSTFEVLGEGAFDATTLTLEGLSDVDATGVLNGYILKYNGTTNKFEAVELVLTTTLAGLDDVDNTHLGDGVVPVFNQTSGKFEFEVPTTNLVDLADVDATGSTDGQVLFKNTTSGKFEFKEVVTATGFVTISDVEPVSVLDNVFNFDKIDDDFVLVSCSASTSNIKVKVIAVTGASAFKPTVTVNGIPATLTRNALTDVWEGYATLTLGGSGTHTLTAVHSDGPTATAEVTVVAPPVVTGATISGMYLNGPGQTEHAAGQSVNVDITADSVFDTVEIMTDPATAAVGVSEIPVTADTTATVRATIADRGNTTVARYISVRVRNLKGTWSLPVLTSNTVDTNNTRPSLLLGAVAYPLGQSALKVTEEATVAATYGNTDSVIFTSNGDLTFQDATLVGNQKVNRSSTGSGYNILTNNITGVVTRTANATTSTASRIVQIANTPATIVSITKPTRLRSKVGSAKIHTITVNCSQGTQSLAMTALIGDLQGGSWGTVDQGLTYTRGLGILDSYDKGITSFDTVYLTNLAGVVTTEADILLAIRQYEVGGFEPRTVFVNAWTNGVSPSEREAAIGTKVVNTAKLLVTVGSTKGEYTNSLATYSSPNSSPTTDIAITGPSGTLNSDLNLVYLRDTRLASANTTGTLNVDIEESI